MLGTNLFALLTRLLSSHFKSRSDETQLQRELLGHRRRQLLHQHIPDVYQAREQFGTLFNDTCTLLVEHDPGGLESLAVNSPYYPELARTLLYQCRKVTSSEEMYDLLVQETSLWFGQQAARQQAALMTLAALLFDIKMQNDA